LNIAILIFPLILQLASCAGPMTPFGAQTNIKKDPTTTPSFNRSLALRSPAQIDEMGIDFWPPRQNWHDAHSLEVIITDPNGIPNGRKISLFYNQMDVTKSFLKLAREEMSIDKTQLRLVFDDLRLLADRDNAIAAIYRRDLFSEPVANIYQDPECPMGSISMSVLDPRDFAHRARVMRLVTKRAKKAGINPSFVAGVIAQESGFNYRAVSSAGAIGLTQITSLAEAQILDPEDKWPRFPGLSSMPSSLIKMAISTGQANSKNEWRLNEDLSIEGGIRYLNYLEDYWSRSKDLMVYARQEDIILASYNSGPARVKRAITRYGVEWKKSPELSEARKYVGKVKSYCYHFSLPTD
jgi:hypothetical protein